VDLNGHVIDGADLEMAAYAYVRECGEAGVQHEGPAVGRIVESLYVTKEKLAAMGLAAGAIGGLPGRAAWWIGVQVNAETFARVKAGGLKDFSIQGHADREPV
jgi:hypothetical protein